MWPGFSLSGSGSPLRAVKMSQEASTHTGCFMFCCTECNAQVPFFSCQGLCLVLSVTASSALLQTLVKKRGAALFTLGQLSVPDRREIIQRELDAFGKKLSDAAFNNQVLVSTFALSAECSHELAFFSVPPSLFDKPNPATVRDATIST